MLEPESNPRTQSGQKDYVNEICSDKIAIWTRNFPACSAVPQPTAPLHALSKKMIV